MELIANFELIFNLFIMVRVKVFIYFFLNENKYVNVKGLNFPLLQKMNPLYQLFYFLKRSGEFIATTLFNE